jgi:hypothetical protein
MSVAEWSVAEWSVVEWIAPVRNHAWVAACFGLLDL